MPFLSGPSLQNSLGSGGVSGLAGRWIGFEVSSGLAASPGLPGGPRLAGGPTCRFSRRRVGPRPGGTVRWHTWRHSARRHRHRGGAELPTMPARPLGAGPDRRCGSHSTACGAASTGSSAFAGKKICRQGRSTQPVKSTGKTSRKWLSVRGLSNRRTGRLFQTTKHDYLSMICRNRNCNPSSVAS